MILHCIFNGRVVTILGRNLFSDCKFVALSAFLQWQWHRESIPAEDLMFMPTWGYSCKIPSTFMSFDFNMIQIQGCI